VLALAERPVLAADAGAGAQVKGLVAATPAVAAATASTLRRLISLLMSSSVHFVVGPENAQPGYF
jgi:hypothetical protein